MMSFFSGKYSPREGEFGYKNLKDYSDEELMWFLDHNITVDLHRLSGITSEILRRMNKQSPILKNTEV